MSTTCYAKLCSLLRQLPGTGHEDGQALVEFNIVLALVAVVAVMAVTAVGLSISGYYESFVGLFP
jgi:Flp pilus assembly pilin Flp